MLNAAKQLFNQHSGEAVVPPKKAGCAQLLPEHFVVDPTQLRYPSTLDFSHSSFKLRDVQLLETVPKAAPQQINLGGNELTSLELVNRFQQLKSLVACANALQVGGGLVLRLPKLTELDLASNRLVAIPPLGELPQLQVLRLQRNQISRNWGELQTASQSLRELDVSQNRLAWQQPTGEFDAAMGVLSKLSRLKELRLGGNPISDTPALRYLVLTYTPKLSRLDGLPVTDQERRGRTGGSAGASAVGAVGAAAYQSAMLVPPGLSDGDDDDDDGGDDFHSGGKSQPRAARQAALARDAAGGGISLEALSGTRQKPPAAASSSRSADPMARWEGQADAASTQVMALDNDAPMSTFGEGERRRGGRGGRGIAGRAGDDDDDDGGGSYDDNDDGAGVGIGDGGTGGGGGGGSRRRAAEGGEASSAKPWGGAGGEAYLLTAPRSARAAPPAAAAVVPPLVSRFRDARSRAAMWNLYVGRVAFALGGRSGLLPVSWRRARARAQRVRMAGNGWLQGSDDARA